MGGAVRTLDGDAVGVVGALFELVMGASQGVAPLAVGGDAKAAVAVAACHTHLRLERVGHSVCVAGGERSAGRLDGVALGQRGGAGAGDDGGVVGTSDGEGNAGCRRCLAVAYSIVDRNVLDITVLKALEGRILGIK